MAQKKQGYLGGLNSSDRAELAERKHRKKQAKKEEKKRHENASKIVVQWEVTIKSAEYVFPMDPNGLSDPYVKFSAGGKVHQTPVIEKTLSPEWNHTETVDAHGDKPLKLILMDKDLVFDDFIGKGKCPWTKSYGSEDHKVNMMRPGDSKIYGVVHLRVRQKNSISMTSL